MKDPDRFEKSIELRASRRRVWQAISTPQEFGAWFGLGDALEIEGDFVPGAKITGTWTIEGKRVSEPFCTIERVEPERLLVFTWVPYEVPPGEDHAKHPTTRIEMRLEEIPIGTRLTISESGFAALPPDKAYKRDQNAAGWDVQCRSIASHLLGEIEVEVETLIAKPLAEVFEAIVDPAKMASYFLSRGSGRMEAKAKLEWEWSDVGAKLEVDVISVEARRVVFVWQATGLSTKVTLALEPDGDRTKLIATEAPFPLTEEAAAKAVGQTQGWTDFGCCLKAYLEHGIDLRRGMRVA